MPQHNFTVGTAIAEVCNNDAGRKSVTIQNTHAANYIIVGSDTATVANLVGLIVYPYGSVTFSREHGDDPTVSRYVIASAITTIVAVNEEF